MTAIESRSAVRTLIVDDEPLARAHLRSLLRERGDVDVVGECGDGRSAIDQIKRLTPDLVLLDIQMPELDGLEVIREVGAEAMPAVVFVTAYDEYALRAFEAGALDYVMKPFANARLERALTRAKERLAVRANQARQVPERLVVKSSGQVLFIDVAEIDWIDAANYYACLHTGTSTHILRRSLAVLEQELDPAAFCRIHRSTIVNLHRVRGLELTDDGEYCVLLKSGERLRASRRFRKSLQERLGLGAD